MTKRRFHSSMHSGVVDHVGQCNLRQMSLITSEVNSKFRGRPTNENL